MVKAFILFAALLGSEAKENYQVNTEESSVEWLAKKVTGKHNGTVALKDGQLEFEGDRLTGGLFTINMTTINCVDLSGEMKGKLEGHLKSDDFFAVETYPTAKFIITKVIPQGPNTYKVVGNITIKGTTEEIQFPATVSEKNGMKVAKADITIDRSKFDVRYGSGSFFDNLGDKTIYDNFDLSVELVASK